MDKRLEDLCQGLDGDGIELVVELATIFRSLPRRSRRDLRFFVEAYRQDTEGFLIVENRPGRKAPEIIFVGRPLPKPFSLLMETD